MTELFVSLPKGEQIARRYGIRLERKPFDVDANIAKAVLDALKPRMLQYSGQSPEDHADFVGQNIRVSFSAMQDKVAEMRQDGSSASMNDMISFWSFAQVDPFLVLDRDTGQIEALIIEGWE